MPHTWTPIIGALWPWVSEKVHAYKGSSQVSGWHHLCLEGIGERANVIAHLHRDEPPPQVFRKPDHHTDGRKEQTMKQRLYGFSVLVAVLAALTLSGTATAGGKEVPLKGRSSGVIVPATCLDPNDSCTVLYGEGEATPLGPFTVTARVVEAETVTGPWMLTTADGDVLFVTFEGSRERKRTKAGEK